MKKMANCWKILITLVYLISSCNLATAQYPIKKTIGKDTVVILMDKQADFINESFEVYKHELNIVKKESETLKTNLSIIDQKYNKLNEEHQNTLKSLAIANAKYDELSKSSSANTIQMFKRLDRNASLTVMSIVFTSLILIVVQH